MHAVPSKCSFVSMDLKTTIGEVNVTNGMVNGVSCLAQDRVSEDSWGGGAAASPQESTDGPQMSLNLSCPLLLQTPLSLRLF